MDPTMNTDIFWLQTVSIPGQITLLAAVHWVRSFLPAIVGYLSPYRGKIFGIGAPVYIDRETYIHRPLD